MRNLHLVLFFMLAAAPVSADEIYDKCMDTSGGTNTGFGKCGGEWVARADAKLNAAWKELYSKAEDSSKKDLLTEQRLWNAFKEQSCNFLVNGDFGREGQVIHFPACRAGVIEQRTKQLEEYMSPGE